MRFGSIPIGSIRYEAPLDLSEGNGEPVLTIDGRRMVGTACWWDPALARPKLRRRQRRRRRVHRRQRRLLAARHPLSAGRRARAWARRTWRPSCAVRWRVSCASCTSPAIVVETNGIGSVPAGPAAPRAGCAAAQGIVVSEQVSTVGKDQRILGALDPLLAAGALRAHASVWRTPFVQEMREWSPGGRGADDGLDAVTLSPAHEPGIEGRRMGGRAGQWQRFLKPRTSIL